MITPWNFPMAIPSWKLFPAIVCGNTCVIKPAEDTPLSTLNLVQTLMDAGMPKGVVNVVFGFGPEAGAPLVEHPDVSAISFTGSSEVGRWVGQTAAAGIKPCSLEMGGKNAMIVMDDANLDLAVEGALWGAFGTTGQRCTATSRILLHKKIAGHLHRTGPASRKVARRQWFAERRADGPPGESATDRDQPKLCGDRSAGGRHAVDRRQRLQGKAHAAGYFFAPTVFVRRPAHMRIAQEEVFGPVVSLHACQPFEHAIEIANTVSVRTFRRSLYSRREPRFQAMRDLETGIVYINAPTIGAEVHLPFGGVKQTGNGHREGGIGALDFYTTWKSVYVDYSDRFQRAQID